MSYLKKIDHVSYACEKGSIEKWAWFHIEVEGGTLIKRIDDARPGDPNSSMKIWCIDYGDFGIALIEGIDRAEKSQVTSFVEKHGDHSCQHVAYDCYSLDKFIKHMKSMGGHPRGDVLVQDDGFGILKLTAHATEPALDPQQDGDQRDWIEARLDAHRGVEEVGLVTGPNRGTLVHA
jgi:hypothetical protein